MKTLLFVLFFFIGSAQAQSTVAPVVNTSTGLVTGVAQTYGGQTVIMDNNGNITGVVIHTPAPSVPRDTHAPTNSAGQPIIPPMRKP